MPIAGIYELRRVVTGNDETGRSRVLIDGPPPKSHTPVMGSGRSYTDLWVWNETPPSISQNLDAGTLGYDFPGPPNGGHLRVVQANRAPDGYDPGNDPDRVPLHEPKLVPPGRMWERGGSDTCTSPMHKTATVDYGIVLAGERVLIVDDREIPLHPGDIVVQVGAFHAWSTPRQSGIMAFDMISARFSDPAGLAEEQVPVLSAPKCEARGDGMVRRIVTIDREPGVSTVVSEGASPDIRFDRARPGFAMARLWVTDSHPAKIVPESLHLPNTLCPPKGGSVLNVLTLPPDRDWFGKVGAEEVQAHFASLGAQKASTFSIGSPHPYMQKTDTLDFCFILKGEVVLVLDEEEVLLRAGDTVIQRGTNHAWSNRTNEPAIVAVAAHATSEQAAL